MSQYIDIGEGIDPAKINKSKECMICHYWFLIHGFKFQDSLCNGCHNLTILCQAILPLPLFKRLIIAVLL